MKAVVFCGPTLSRAEISRGLDTVEVDICPPAARGDLLAAARRQPVAIGLIDGYFDRVPSVWHKEILWAMSEGIHVFGAASMGALRAAELVEFGMEGVGEVFESFRSGELEDDDEVAIAHAAKDGGYRAASEAMVNIRVSLRAAERDAVISEETRVALEVIGKALWYPDRSYPAVLQLAERATGKTPELAALRDWLPHGRKDQKRDDARLMLSRMAERDRTGWSPKKVDYVFAHTDAWSALWRDVGVSEGQRGDQGTRGKGLESGIGDELSATGRFRAAHDGALVRAVCIDHARRSGSGINARAVEAVVDEFRRERGLLEAAQFDDWLRVQGLAENDIVPYFRTEAMIRRAGGAVKPDLVHHLIDHLRATGEYGAVAARSRAKNEVLVAHGLDSPNLRDAGLSEADLWRWYFVERLHRDVPPNVEAYARMEHTDLDQLRTAALREFLYLRLCPEAK